MSAICDNQTLIFPQGAAAVLGSGFVTGLMVFKSMTFATAAAAITHGSIPCSLILGGVFIASLGTAVTGALVVSGKMKAEHGLYVTWGLTALSIVISIVAISVFAALGGLLPVTIVVLGLVALAANALFGVFNIHSAMKRVEWERGQV